MTDLEVRCLREIQAYLKENPRDEFRGDTDFYQFTLGGGGSRWWVYPSRINTSGVEPINSWWLSNNSFILPLNSGGSSPSISNWRPLW